jgi:hypothetical protein
LKQRFITKRFSDDKAKTITKANEIIDAYRAQGYRLTLRQLYYQFVSRDLIPNSERSYKNLGVAISEGRLAGLIDWTAIEDRVRVPKLPRQWSSIQSLVDSALYAYRLPRWEGQDNYVELWVEKDALAGVLQPLAEESHVTLMVNRGYSSQSAMYEAAQRFISAGEEHSKLHLLYLGDHDPSGEDMVRDVRDRLQLFGADVNVVKVALTMAQVEQYDPPPNPAKMTDSRANAYVEEHGNSSWEVDALPPDVLSALIRAGISNLLDQDLMDEVIAKEEKDKAALKRSAAKIE